MLVLLAPLVTLLILLKGKMRYKIHKYNLLMKRANLTYMKKERIQLHLLYMNNYVWCFNLNKTWKWIACTVFSSKTNALQSTENSIIHFMVLSQYIVQTGTLD